MAANESLNSSLSLLLSEWNQLYVWNTAHRKVWFSYLVFSCIVSMLIWSRYVFFPFLIFRCFELNFIFHTLTGLLSFQEKKIHGWFPMKIVLMNQ